MGEARAQRDRRRQAPAAAWPRALLGLWVAASVLLGGCQCDGEPRAAPRAATRTTAAKAVPPSSATAASSRVPTSSPSTPSQLRLDGELLQVRWTDGDTFSWRDPSTGRKRRARLSGFNALESYGPVHQWASWQASELATIAEQATHFARGRSWQCTDTGRSGGYGRQLVRCADLARELCERGLAHVFQLEGSPAAALLAAQQRAQQARRGMWAQGIPPGIVTSLHSADERKTGAAYDRVADTSTGAAEPVPHRERYEPCQWICRRGSCMVYLPFEQRYGKRRRTCPGRAPR